MVKKLTDYRSNCITSDTSILTALSKLDEVKCKVLFVLDDKDRVIASLTDGDIRRAILKGLPLSANAVEFARKEPFVITEGDDETAREGFARRKLDAIPVVDSDHRIVGLLAGSDIGRKNKTPISVPVVIMAGGKGTRLYLYTKILPKPLIPIDDIPISERIIKSFAEAGCTDFSMIVN